MCSWRRATLPGRWNFTVTVSPSSSGWRIPIPATLVGSAICRCCIARSDDARKAQGDLAAALASYRASLAITQRLVSLYPTNKQPQDDLDIVVERIGSLAYRFVLARNFGTALEAADQAISLSPDEVWFYANRAHALMFAGRTDEARQLYLKYRDKKDLGDGKSWETTVLEDFTELRKAGIADPLMDEIEKIFTSAG
jgi:tetratricopeptide (TPR) repeat protein